MVTVIDGSHGPGDANPEEDIHCVTARHVAHRSVGVLVLNGCHFTRESV